MLSESCVVLDRNYVPSEHEIKEYAKEIGMQFPQDENLLYVAKAGLLAPLPSHWSMCKSDTQGLYFYNNYTKRQQKHHPLMPQTKQLYQNIKQGSYKKLTFGRQKKYKPLEEESQASQLREAKDFIKEYQEKVILTQKQKASKIFKKEMTKEKCSIVKNFKAQEAELFSEFEKKFSENKEKVVSSLKQKAKNYLKLVTKQKNQELLTLKQHLQKKREQDSQDFKKQFHQESQQHLESIRASLEEESSELQNQLETLKAQSKLLKSQIVQTKENHLSELIKLKNTSNQVLEQEQTKLSNELNKSISQLQKDSLSAREAKTDHIETLLETELQEKLKRLKTSWEKKLNYFRKFKKVEKLMESLDQQEKNFETALKEELDCYAKFRAKSLQRMETRETLKSLVSPRNETELAQNKAYINSEFLNNLQEQRHSKEAAFQSKLASHFKHPTHSYWLPKFSSQETTPKSLIAFTRSSSTSDITKVMLWHSQRHKRHLLSCANVHSNWISNFRSSLNLL